MFLPVTGHQGNDGAEGAAIRRTRRTKALKVTGLTLAGLLVLGAGAAGWAYWQLNDNIRGVDINTALGDDRPARAGATPSPDPSATAEPLPAGSLNILVLGSD